MPQVPPAAIAAASIGATLIGQREQRQAQEEALEARQAAQQRAIAQRNQQIAAANQAMEEQNQLRLAAMQAQSDIADRSSEAFRGAARDQLGNLEQDVAEEERRQRQSLNEVIDRDVAGEAGQARQVGSDVQGRVSEDFRERGERAGAENEADARRLADQMATIGAFRQVPVQRGQQLANVGQAVRPFQREAQNRATTDRLRIAQAGRLPPAPPGEPTEFVDPTSPLGQTLQGIGEGGLFLFGQGFGGRGNVSRAGSGLNAPGGPGAPGFIGPTRS